MASDHDRGEVLEAVYELGGNGSGVAASDVATRTGTGGPELAGVVDALRAEGFVEAEGATLRLTPRGEQEALTVMRRHRLAERLLRDVIGLDWWRIHHEAQRWQDVISDDVERRLIEILGDPGTCPHGNPIPGSANLPDQGAAVTLSVAPVGPVTVVRITEELEEDDDALRLLEAAGVIPDRPAEVVGRDPDGTVHLVGAIADTQVPAHVAASTYVTVETA